MRFLTSVLLAVSITMPSNMTYDPKQTGSTLVNLSADLANRGTVITEFTGVDQTGNTDSAAGIQNALNVSGRVILPPGTYKIGSSLTIPTSAILTGAGQQKTILKRAFTGDFITSQGSYSAIYDLTIDGNTSTNGNGRGILIGGGTIAQKHVNVAIINFNQAVLEFAADSGSGFSSFGSTYQTTGANGRVASVKITGTDSAANPRAFDQVTSNGSTLFDFGGCNHCWASKFYTNGLIFSSSAAFNVGLTEARIGTVNVTKATINAGSTSLEVSTGTGSSFSVGDGVTVWGAGRGGTTLVARISAIATDTLRLDLPASTLVKPPASCRPATTAGCVSRADVIQGAAHMIRAISAQGMINLTRASFIDAQLPDWNLRDLGTDNSISQVALQYGVTWTGTATNPRLGNGALLARASRRGAWVMVQIDLSIGSTTALGTGTWEFSLPFADLSSGPVQVCGSALAINAGATVGYTGVVRVQPAGQKVRAFFPTVSGTSLRSNVAAASATGPIAWANGDTLRFNCEYRVP